MSAFEEFEQERSEIDALFSEGYTVTAIAEDLDGTQVTFSAPQGGETVCLQLLTADARKHITSVLFAAARPEREVEACS